MANSQFGHYEIRSLLGAGGMGQVYLAYDSRLRRQVAIKILPDEFTGNKNRLFRFEREAYAASSLNHPNILTIYEIGQQDDHHFIATEYVEGESLHQRLSRGHMELRETLNIVIQVADALAAAHEAGIVHRDIKPENVMVRRDGYVKVLDFGLAKLVDEASSADVDPEATTMKRGVKTAPGVVMGTSSYMSPEQARGLEVDARSDIWSLGAVLYELVSGRLPFEGQTTSDVIAMILHREPPSLLLYRSEVPAELERIVEKALTKEREERYQLSRELSLDLKRLRQRLELDAELERSVTPDSESKPAIESANSGRASSASAPDNLAVATGETRAARTVSSADYVFKGIKRHQRRAVLILATLILVAVASLIYYRYSRVRTAEIISVAVMPFTNQSGDPNMDYLSDGITESLINNLSQLVSLKVISRASVFKYKGKDIDPQEVAQALGVQAIVTGRVMQRGDQLQIGAELVNVSDKTQLWGDQFNRKVTDTLTVQTEISQQIAERLRLRLTKAEQHQLVKDVQVNPAAYEQLLKGRFYRQNLTQENLRNAVDCFNQSIAIDDRYALAYALLAETYQQMVGSSFLDPKDAKPKAEAAAKKALELDEGLAEAHYAVARNAISAWDWVGAEQELKRSIELSPSWARAHSGYAAFLSNMGRHDEAISEIKRARELDPLNIAWSGNLGYFLLFARRYDQAVEQLRKVLEVDKNNALAHVTLGYTYNSLEKYDQAIAEFEEDIKLQGETTSTLCYLGYALAKAGHRNRAEKILKRLETTKEYVSSVELAIVYIAFGHKERALSALEHAYAVHDVQMQYLATEPHFDELRSEPRFKELIRKIGLPQ